MGCNCKNDKNSETLEQTESTEDKSIVIKVLNTIVRVFIFMTASSIASIIVIPFTIFLLYKSIFYNEGFDVTNLLLAIAKPLRRRKKDDEEEEIDDEYENFKDLNEEKDLILLNEEKWYNK